MSLKRLIKFSKDNYFITIFVLAIIFVGIVSLFKIYRQSSKPTFIYVKVKLGQGLWWASYNRPNIWLAQGIKKGDVERSLTGSPVAEVLGVRYYPWLIPDQFDVFVSLKLRVGGSLKSQKYTFKRSTIGVGSPIEVELSSSQISGTITELNTTPFADNYIDIDKTIILTKQYAYPWEYDAIRVGDKYFDGQDYVFEVIDKKSSDTSSLSNVKGVVDPTFVSARKNISVVAKIKVKEKNGQYIFGEEQVIRPGKQIYISTPNITFTDYFVGEIK